MRFLVDECTGPRVASWLRDQQHDVFSVYEQARGLDDASVLAMAVREDRILITNDTDFGERVFRSRQPHRGVVLLRLADERSASKIAKREKGIWQRRYWEHLIRDDADLARHVDYIHFNPVKHGFVSRVSDWPHSSFHHYVRRGLLPSDWGGDVSDIGGRFGE